MDVGKLLESVWELLNSPTIIAMLAGGLLWLLNKLYAAKPAWAAYEGTIISAIKFAERMVPEDSQNKAASKLHTALNYFIKVYEATHGKKPPKKLQDEVAQGIQIVHEELEISGTLKKPAPMTVNGKPRLLDPPNPPPKTKGKK